MLSGKLAKMFRFEYAPWDFIPHPFRIYEKPHDIAKDQKEVVYAILRGGDLYFRPPTLNPIVRDLSPQGEIDAWQSMLAEFRFYDAVVKTGEIGNVALQTYSDITKELVDAELTAHAVRSIENFISLDELTAVELKKLRRDRARTFGEDTEHAYSSDRWYHVLIVEKARRLYKPASIFRNATTIIPEVSPNPRQSKFFGLSALKTLLKHSREAAPYLFAWATFCIRAAAKGEAYADGVSTKTSNQWTPQEDYLLINHYRKFPKMTKEEVNQLKRKLPTHAWTAILHRVRWLNRILAKVLHVSRMKTHTIGRLSFSDPSPEARQREVMRILFVLGVVSYRQSLNERARGHMPLLAPILSLSDAKVDLLHLPYKYRMQEFETQIKKQLSE